MTLSSSLGGERGADGESSWASLTASSGRHTRLLKQR
uniref:Uncharacterized protein n=1 Tax=Arundo donax TaxID=35708 RepID=A0A0A9HVC5_ARUDO